MKKHIFWIAILTFSISFISCNKLGEAYSQEDPERKDSLTLKQKDLRLPLDSVTGPTANVMNFHQENGQNILSFIQGATIHQYDLDNLKKISSLELDENSQGLGRLRSFKILNQDTIAVVSRYKLSLVNKQGELLSVFHIDSRFSNRSLFDSNHTLGSESIFRNGPYLYTLTIPQLSLASDVRRNQEVYSSLNQLALRWNMQTENFDTFLKYPEQMTKNHYSSMMKMRVDQTVNFSKSEIVYNFRPVDSLYVYGFNGEKVGQYFAGSKYNASVKSAEPSIYNDDRYNLKYSLTNPQYTKVLYDPFRKLYYRVTQGAITEDEFMDQKWFPKIGVIILNEGFEIVGEVDNINPKVSNVSPVVTNQGLLFMNMFPGSEEFIEFELYEVEQLN